jgi:hypothetical protein
MPVIAFVAEKKEEAPVSRRVVMIRGRTIRTILRRMLMTLFLSVVFHNFPPGKGLNGDEEKNFFFS